MFWSFLFSRFSAWLRGNYAALWAYRRSRYQWTNSCYATQRKSYGGGAIYTLYSLMRGERISVRVIRQLNLLKLPSQSFLGAAFFAQLWGEESVFRWHHCCQRMVKTRHVLSQWWRYSDESQARFGDVLQDVLCVEVSFFLWRRSPPSELTELKWYCVSSSFEQNNSVENGWARWVYINIVY